MDLRTKVAIVTGGGEGPGRAYAQELAHHGCAIVVHDVNAESARVAAADIVEEGGRAVAATGRIGSTDTARALVGAAVDSYGRVDVLVVNGDGVQNTAPWGLSDEDVNALLELEIPGIFTSTREAIARFREQGSGGRIICVSSLGSQRESVGQNDYSAAEPSVAGMVRTWSFELRRFGITANAVCPHLTRTATATMPAFAPYIELSAYATWDHWVDADTTCGENKGPFGGPIQQLKKTTALSALSRRDTGPLPSQAAAGVITYLASDDAEGVTGQTFCVRDGRLAHWSRAQLLQPPRYDANSSADSIAERSSGRSAP